MKKWMLLLLLVPNSLLFAQVNSPETTDGKLITIVETEPEYPGGEQEMMKYLQQNVSYPHEASENGIQGKVYISFVVDKDGSISETKVLRGVDSLLDAEAIRVVNSMPKWTPGTQKGVPVKVRFNLPINFYLPDFDYTTYEAQKAGLKNMDTGNYESAINNFTKLIDARKYYAKGYYLRGMAYHKNGNKKKAKKDLKQAKKMGSKKAEEYLKNIKN